ncbi:Glycine/D-amino acid oxidase [Rhizobiales bacterium GAS113]|nr:Glycine/D-amino acid oxidase [Rhizobiales bacterium GAS113]SEC22834.1 Glycine/D-amino acid oxidase [Rhizobiales bacterium GAS188]
MTNTGGNDFDVAVIGAGNIGIAVAYYLVKNHGVKTLCLIDARDPMSLTSAQSGENYRNWWPHPVMAAYTNHSIDLLEEISRASGNRINMSRRGYALATRRSKPEDLINELFAAYAQDDARAIRIHEVGGLSTYEPPVSAAWEKAPSGVDVILDRALIRKTFPSFARDIATVLHIRRAGAISGQQLGQFMLESIREAGGKFVRGNVTSIAGASPFRLMLEVGDAQTIVAADRVVNAAGPFIQDIARMLGHELPATCVYQQKIAFEDRNHAIPRNMPFSIDLDGQTIDWPEGDREILAEDPVAARLLAPMPGAIHCRPDGAEDGKWIKLGWAYNHTAADPHAAEPVDPQFPDTVLRGASRLNPTLKAYIGRLPRGAHHYGGYYTMTDENWPLIGPTDTPGAFIAGALSGFGSMAACATGEICAAWVAGSQIPGYAMKFSSARYQDAEFMETITTANKGHL